MKQPSLTATLLALCLALPASALELASPFSEHMVLQRDRPLPVWGWAEPGETVTVTLDQTSAKASAGEDGRWSLSLPAHKAGGPLTFTASTAKETIRFEDVLVGEVWICSGQSNMQMSRGKMIGYKELKERAAGRPLRSMTVTQDVSLEPAARCKGSWKADGANSAVAYAFQLELQELIDVPVGVIVTCWGSSFIEGWMPRDLTGELPHFREAMEKFDKHNRARVEELKAAKKMTGGENVWLRTRPNILYNAMLHPLVPYACRGVVWYQGEANAKHPERYGPSLKAWCRRLRKEWNDDSLHLLAVMLPGFGSGQKSPLHPDQKTWAWMREAQLAITGLDHTAVANTIDLGDSGNIHPADKAPIGKRLALLAARDVHGRQVVAEGPVLDEAKIEGNTIRITFRHAGGLSTTDGQPPREFWIAGEDKQWQRATASLKGGGILLHAEGLPAPRFVRYAWTGKPDVNLVNAAGLPALPFRTDR